MGAPKAPEIPALRPNRTTAAERDRRRHGLEDDRDRVDHAATARHRMHDIGNILAGGVLGAEVDDSPDDDQAKG